MKVRFNPVQNLADNLSKDISYAVRAILRTPGFALVAIAALALGIGANTAFFSLVYSVLLRPLPVSHPESIRNVHVTTFGEGRRAHFGTQYFVAWQEFQQMRAGSKSADLAGIAEVRLMRKGDSRPVRAHLVSDNLLPTMGGRPLLGRFFLPEETSRAGSGASVILSYRAWRDWFGSSPSVVGNLITLNRTPFTVVGVADERTTGPLMMLPDVWIPLTMQPITRSGEPLIYDSTNAWVQIFARRRPGFDDAALKAEMDVLAKAAILPSFPKRQVQVTVVPGAFLNYPFVQNQTRPIIAIAFLAVTLVLIVACANVANMLLARGLSRRRELAIRLSIGAGRGRLIQQLLTESLLLAILGAAAGIAFAQAAMRGIMAMIPASTLGSNQIDLTPDSTVLLYTIAVALVTGILFGLFPAISTVGFDLTPSLKSEGLQATTPRRGSAHLQNTLIVVQVGISLVLLFNAGLLVRGLQKAFDFDTGQDTRNLMVVDLYLRQQQYSAEDATRFVTGLRESISTMPGIVAVSNTFIEPLHEQCGMPVTVNGREQRVSCDEIGTAFFQAAGIPLLYGREFTPAEMRNENPVAIVDKRFATENFGTENAVGRSINQRNIAYEIVGVAAVTRPLDLQSRSDPKVYRPMRGLRHNEAKMLVRYQGSSLEAEQNIRKAVGQLDANVSPAVRRVEDGMDSILSPVRIAAAAAGGLGAMALLLAATGIYGVVAFAIGRRTRELGIRMALGASRPSVCRLVLWQGFKPVLIGGLAGLLLAGGAASLIRTMLYGLSPLDPASYLIASIVLGLAALGAIAVPASQALRVDPAVTLRYE